MTDLSLLLDDATAEAKRRGHRVVVPAHLAVVFANRHGNAIAAWTDVLPEAERTLSLLPVTYDTPKVDAATQALAPVLQAGDLPAIAAAVADAVRANAPVDNAANQVGDPVIDPHAPPAAVPIPDAHAAYAAIVAATSDVIGRSNVVESILDALDRKQPVPVLLVGEEGSGRTSIATAMANVLAMRDIPVVRIDNASCPTERQQAVLTEMLRLSQSAVLFIDDIEIALGLGYPAGVSGAYLAALRPAIEQQRIVAVVSTPYLARLQGTDRELIEEFATVTLPPLDDGSMRAVVNAKAAELAGFHGVDMPNETIEAALAPPQDGELGTHPALALRRLDVAATRAARRAREADWAREARETAHPTDLPLAARVERRVDPASTAAALRQQIVGQDTAIDRVAARLAITVAELDINPHRPDGVFLFAGPTGVGKTALALALAEQLFGSADAMVRIDMSELHDEHTVAKLVGAPPGYIGHDDPSGWLTSQIRRMPQCVLLLDEIEKADPLVWNTFLQVFDAGRLTDFRGMVADFREVVIVMTTNLGAEVFSSTGSVGFVETAPSAAADTSSVQEVLRRTMRPELLNRIDEIIVFSPLSAEAVSSIARMRTDNALALLRERGYAVEGTSDLYGVIERVGFSTEYGAREILRTVERLILQPLAALPAGAYRPVVEGDDLRWEPAST